jgi:polyribonucleotide nucleotidyltransferase
MEETGIKEGDTIEVKLLEIDKKTGKLRLSRKALLPRDPNAPAEEPRPRREFKGEHRGERREHKPNRE